MALSTILNERKETPYYRPPNLHICILKIKEEERVVAWEFTDASASPATIKTNRVAAISDGDSVSTLVLFEEFWSKVKEGASYIIRGYGLLGETPPYHIRVTRQTQFFRGSKITVSSDLKDEAERALNPPSQVVDVWESTQKGGLLTVRGVVVECSPVKKIRSGREYVPVKNIKIKQDEFAVRVCLWREVSTTDISLGDVVTISHLKAETTVYGKQLTSTKHSELTKSQTTNSGVAVIGVTESCTDEVEVLLEDGRVLKMAEKMWSPFHDLLEEGPLTVDLVLEGTQVQQMKLSSE